MCWEMTKCICATIKVGLGRTELSCGVRVLKEVEVGRKTFMRKLGNIQYIFWFSIIYSLAEGGEKGREGWVLARTSWQLIIRFKLKYLWKGTCRGVASFRTVNCKILLLTYCVPVPKCNEWFISFPLLKKKKKPNQQSKPLVKGSKYQTLPGKLPRPTQNGDQGTYNETNSPDMNDTEDSSILGLSKYPCLSEAARALWKRQKSQLTRETACCVTCCVTWMDWAVQMIQWGKLCSFSNMPVF